MYDILFKEKLNKKDIRKLINLLEEAYKMGKRMNNKLKQYKFNYDDDWWVKEEEKVVQEKIVRRKNRTKK
jgi:hypothetical protein